MRKCCKANRNKQTLGLVLCAMGIGMFLVLLIPIPFWTFLIAIALIGAGSFLLCGM